MKKNLFFVFMCMIALAFSFSSCENEAKEKLEKIVSEANAECPTYIDDATYLTSVALEGDKVVYSCIIDEEYYPIDYLRANKSAVKGNIVNNLKTNSIAKTMFKVCKDADCKIMYRYKGDTTGQVLTIEISPSEM